MNKFSMVTFYSVDGIVKFFFSDENCTFLSHESKVIVLTDVKRKVENGMLIIESEGDTYYSKRLNEYKEFMQILGSLLKIEYGDTVVYTSDLYDKYDISENDTYKRKEFCPKWVNGKFYLNRTETRAERDLFFLEKTPGEYKYTRLCYPLEICRIFDVKKNIPEEVGTSEE